MNAWGSHPGNGPLLPVILVVDDEELLRNFLCDVLEAAGYFVLSAADGLEALDISRRFRGTIHVLLSDVIMPRLDGISLEKQLLNERPGIKVLLMSGTIEELPEDVEFLSKPFRTEVLKKRLLQLLLASAGAA